ncbi:MAG: phosphoenolpyruvate carboxykinase (ATP) [Phycisphaerae bacterium]
MEGVGIEPIAKVHWNLTPDDLIKQAVARSEGKLAANGALAVRTGKCTGRQPKDRFIVEEPTTKDKIDWGAVNVAVPPATFDRLHRKIIDHYRGKDLFVRECYSGADPENRLKVRVVNETAWHNLFVAQLFIEPEPEALADFQPDFTVLNAPWCLADPAKDGTRSEVFVVVNFEKRLILVGGTQYAGEIKKSIFSVMNYLLPERGILSMHCSANIGRDGDTALFFGLSGTGKTTLSADPNRRLIGDDEHGWSQHGVFNFEGGCYAKCIKLSLEYEPQIYNAIRHGAVLENVVVDDAGKIDFDSAEITENTRAAYPLNFIDNAVIPSVGGHPRNVILLTCDAFGVLPPVSRLSPDQAMYHFMSGYTAKVAGTEAGVTEPQATFSACFGAPFLPLPPSKYATMLGQRLAKHRATCWLVNTGWSSGPYGVGQRMNIHHTRAMITAALEGTLAQAGFYPDPIFGFEVPNACPNVPAEVLTPKNTWPDPQKYDQKAKELAGLFIDNFAKFKNVPANVTAAGPKR